MHGLVSFGQSGLPSSSDFWSQTFVVSFQVMPALSHSCLVRGWTEGIRQL